MKEDCSLSICSDLFYVLFSVSQTICILVFEFKHNVGMLILKCVSSLMSCVQEEECECLSR